MPFIATLNADNSIYIVNDPNTSDLAAPYLIDPALVATITGLPDFSNGPVTIDDLNPYSEQLVSAVMVTLPDGFNYGYQYLDGSDSGDVVPPENTGLSQLAFYNTVLPYQPCLWFINRDENTQNITDIGNLQPTVGVLTPYQP